MLETINENHASKLVLLAEDDKFISDIYSNQLKRDGYRVDIARDGAMALDKIREEHPDLLILDVMLPKIDGCQLLKMIRQDPSTRNLKVIVISNLSQSEFPEDISHLGVLQCLLKVETSPEEVVEKVNEAIY